MEAGQSIAAAARTLGVVDQTLFNWVKAHRAGKLTGADGKSKVVSAEQMEISRLRAERIRPAKSSLTADTKRTPPFRKQATSDVAAAPGSGWLDALAAVRAHP